MASPREAIVKSSQFVLRLNESLYISNFSALKVVVCLVRLPGVYREPVIKYGLCMDWADEAYDTSQADGGGDRVPAKKGTE